MPLQIGVSLVLVLSALVYEKAAHAKRRRKFLHVIHVNGTRGKTTVCRMLDSVLRAKYRVFTKTTGSDARILHVGGEDRPLSRRGASRIHEQLRVMRAAHRENAQICILECMAVRPELQRASEEALLNADIAVITNVRYDHVFEMGRTLDEIAASLATVIPRNGTLYTADPLYAGYFETQCRARQSALVRCGGDPAMDNERIVRAVAASLGVSQADIDEGLRNVRPDLGMRHLYTLRNDRGEAFDFLNLFAANDPLSALEHVRARQARYPLVRFVYGNRYDRPDRIGLFAEHFFPAFPRAEVLVAGDCKPLAKRLLGRVPGLRVTPARSLRDCFRTPGGALLVGVGNIKGAGEKLLGMFAKEEAVPQQP